MTVAVIGAARSGPGARDARGPARRPVGGRVAEPPGVADGAGAGVVGVGDGELGRGQHRLAGRGGHLGGRGREAGVLAFVVRDDPLQAGVVGEAALAHEAGLVRLDPEPQVHDRVDVGMAGDEVEHFGDGVAGLAAGQVDRVVAAPPGGRLLVDRGAQVVGERDQLEGRAGDGVGGDDPPPAGGGHHRDAGPAGSGWVANVAAASKASSTDVARVTPAWRHIPSKTRSSLASAPVWDAAARARPWWRRPSAARAAGCGGDVPDPLEELAALARRRPLRRTRARTAVCSASAAKYSRKSGTVTAAALPADTARLTPTPVGAGEVLERGHEVAGLADDPDPPGRRVRGDDLGAEAGRGRHEPLAVRSGKEDAELVGERDELGLRGAAGARPPRRTRPR